MSRSAEARSEQTGANRRAVAAAFGLSVEGGGGAERFKRSSSLIIRSFEGRPSGKAG